MKSFEEISRILADKDELKALAEKAAIERLDQLKENYDLLNQGTGTLTMKPIALSSDAIEFEYIVRHESGKRGFMFSVPLISLWWDQIEREHARHIESVVNPLLKWDDKAAEQAGKIIAKELGLYEGNYVIRFRYTEFPVGHCFFKVRGINKIYTQKVKKDYQDMRVICFEVQLERPSGGCFTHVYETSGSSYSHLGEVFGITNSRLGIMYELQERKDRLAIFIENETREIGLTEAALAEGLRKAFEHPFEGYMDDFGLEVNESTALLQRKSQFDV